MTVKTNRGCVETYADGENKGAKHRSTMSRGDDLSYFERSHTGESLNEIIGRVLDEQDYSLKTGIMTRTEMYK